VQAEPEETAMSLIAMRTVDDTVDSTHNDESVVGNGEPDEEVRREEGSPRRSKGRNEEEDRRTRPPVLRRSEENMQTEALLSQLGASLRTGRAGAEDLEDGEGKGGKRLEGGWNKLQI
jgi:hypothetical protein